MTGVKRSLPALLLPTLYLIWGCGALFGGGVQGRLSETGLYSNSATKTVASGIRRYEPQYPLWSDGALKRRWIYLPSGTQIINGSPDGTPTPAYRGNMDYWIFPIGTKFWKEFSFPNIAGCGRRRIETRFITKTGPTTYEFSSYQWDEDETEAWLVSADGAKDVYKTGPGTTHSIPSQADCVTCHNRGGDMVLGFDALQLSWDRDPLSPHARPLGRRDLTLRDLIREKILTFVPIGMDRNPPRIVSATAEGRAVAGYLHANCGNCHNPTGTAQFSYLNFRYPLATIDEASSPLFQTALNQVTGNLQIPGVSPTYRIRPGEPDHSAVIYAMMREGTLPMPPLGVGVVDFEAVELIREWVRKLQ